MPKLMIVGWFEPRFGAEWLAQGFEARGYQVIRIACDLEKPKNSGYYDYHVLDAYVKGRVPERSAQIKEAYQVQLMMRRIRLQDIVAKFPCDQILFIQNKMAWDFDGINIPLDYYHTDIITTNLPLHAEKIRGWFYAYVGGFEELKDAHQYEAMHGYWNRLVPYGFIPEHFKGNLSWENREIFCGFAGSFSQNDHATNGLKKYIYKYRQEYLKITQEYLKEEFDLREFGDYYAYIKHLESCKTAINIPGILGCINQRQYEILAAGALLIQWWYPELESLGFKDHENCMTFRNETELKSIFDWIRACPWEANEIRLTGLKMAQNHTWQRRAEEMIARMTTLSDRELQRVTWVEYQRQKEVSPELEEKYEIPMIKVTAK